MKLLDPRKILVAAALGVITLVGSTVAVNAQDNTNTREQQRIERQRQKDLQKIRKHHPQVVNQGGGYWDSSGNYHDYLGNVYDRNGKVLSSSGNRNPGAVVNNNDRRDNDNYRRDNDNYRNNNNDYRTFRNGARYRVRRGNSNYETDYRGAQLLQDAVNRGYQQGYEQGVQDRQRRRRSNYSGNSVYRSGNFGYQNYVASSQYRYYFQQGFQRGYDDGFNSTTRYGYVQNGSYNILGSILNTILNITEQ